MEDIFISKIHINKVRHLENVDILLSETERKHLILTGKNGSGKTSLLQTIKGIFIALQTGFYKELPEYISRVKRCNASVDSLKMELANSDLPEQIKIGHHRQINDLLNQIKNDEIVIQRFSHIDVTFNNEIELQNKFSQGNLLLSFFNSKRTTELLLPTGINKIQLKDTYGVEERANRDFVQYIVNLKADRSFARDDNDEKTIQEVDAWFYKFESALQEIFGDSRLKLEFDKKNYNFKIVTSTKESFDFITLSDGFSAIIEIVSELIMRMENKSSKIYEIEGIVLIDEIETHLHIDLQKKILPFLTSFFPKIQFIVTTHSPFVLSSVDNAVIFDLETKQRVEDLSGYSMGAIVESYFDSDTYSEEVKRKIKEYEILLNKDILTEEEKEQKFDLKLYFKDLPKTLSPELSLKISQLELATLVL